MWRNAFGRRAAVVGAGAIMLTGLSQYAGAQLGQLAQLGSFGGSGGVSLQAPPVATGRASPFEPPGRAQGALPIGDWLLYPTAFAGIVYDTNINQSSTNETSGFGLRLVPSILAEYLNGISKTTLYGMADGRIYTNQRISNSANATSARVGAIEYFQPAPDWTLNGQVDYTRQQSLFSTFGIDQSVTTPNPTGVGLAPSANPLAYHQFTGTASVQKSFAQAFAIFGGSVLHQLYDDTPAGAPSPNGTVYTGTARGGYWITPAFYGYVEGSLDRRDYDSSALSSSGYRVVGGLGSDQIGLFRGEIYGGYQAEDFESAAIGTAGSAVFGGRIYYYPVPELTLSLAADRTIGASLLAATPTSPAGVSTEVTSALFKADYSIAPEWTATARAGYIHTDFLGAGRRDDAWTIGPTITYSVWQNFGISFDYQHLELRSNAVGQGFSRDVATLGLTYKY